MPRGRGKRPRQQKSLLSQGRGLVKRTQLHSFDPAGSDDVEYEVEEILAERTSYGQEQFHIKWKDLDESANTREPLSNLPGDSDGFEDASKDLRSVYWQHFEVRKEGKKILQYRCKHCGPGAEHKDYCGNTSNLRAHLLYCHKDIMVQLKVEEAESGTRSDSAQRNVKTGSIEAILPQISSEQRDRLHRRITFWLVRKGRPLTLPERDVEFREIFAEIFRGCYTPPTYQQVLDNICALSAEGQTRLVTAIRDLLEEGILPSIAGDIWSEGGIAIFGILVYYVDANFVLHEKLVAAIPFSSVRHTGFELELATKRACAIMGIGKFVELLEERENAGEDTVADTVHCTVSDNASNIVNGWLCFDGHECNDHTLALIVMEFLSQTAVKRVFKKLRGMTGHFNHSVLGAKLLYDCERRCGLRECKPPQDNDTRSGWGGACRQATWYLENKAAVLKYDTEHPTKASTAVPNLDGSVYKDHQLTSDEWNIVRECVYILTYCSSATDLLQGTKYPTVNLVLPILGKLARTAAASTRLKYQGKPVEIVHKDVLEARQNLYGGLTRRYFTNLLDCKLEDFCIATFLDPRYKSFNFKFATRWMQGELTKEKAVGFARHCWENNWRPAKDPAEKEADLEEPSKKRRKVQSVTVEAFLADSDDEDEAPSLEPDTVQ
ncbi:hypothetical protein CYMTET_4228 [Cymbomonas tetramitiformis]|uniref:Chromo domain-containing protein n=1 Tax=Cymbomonas tetramitiformis TaxID=36881 RepID=A0AAE0LK89_9CHLO|nr:hypothetical protein CYMTET_4228 [Cymbomonas tetramitiformis]